MECRGVISPARIAKQSTGARQSRFRDNKRRGPHNLKGSGGAEQPGPDVSVRDRIPGLRRRAREARRLRVRRSRRKSNSIGGPVVNPLRIT